jgi:hypothetical protein
MFTRLFVTIPTLISIPSDSSCIPTASAITEGYKYVLTNQNPNLTDSSTRHSPKSIIKPGPKFIILLKRPLKLPKPLPLHLQCSALVRPLPFYG